MHSGSEIELFPVTVRLGATLFFVLLNGFFVAAEFALVKVRRSPGPSASSLRSSNR